MNNTKAIHLIKSLDKALRLLLDVAQHEISNFHENDTYGLCERVVDDTERAMKEPDGIFDSSREELSERMRSLQLELKAHIGQQVRTNRDRIRYEPELDEDGCGNYPVTSTLYGKHDNPSIDITDVYLLGDEIYADGIDNATGEKREGFFIYPEHLCDVFHFIGHVLQS